MRVRRSGFRSVQWEDGLSDLVESGAWLECCPGFCL